MNYHPKTDVLIEHSGMVAFVTRLSVWIREWANPKNGNQPALLVLVKGRRFVAGRWARPPLRKRHK